MTATLSPPDRSLAQRRSALQRANEIRMLRAEWKREVKAGRSTVSDVLADCPWWICSMRVGDVLLAGVGVGEWRVRKILRASGVPAAKRIGSLSPRQVCEITRLLGGEVCVCWSTNNAYRKGRADA